MHFDETAVNIGSIFKLILDTASKLGLKSLFEFGKAIDRSKLKHMETGEKNPFQHHKLFKKNCDLLSSRAF